MLFQSRIAIGDDLYQTNEPICYIKTTNNIESDAH